MNNIDGIITSDFEGGFRTARINDNALWHEIKTIKRLVNDSFKTTGRTEDEQRENRHKYITRELLKMGFSYITEKHYIEVQRDNKDTGFRICDIEPI